MKSVKFFKATGQGNDYIVIENSEDFEMTPHFLRLLCDRHRGIGGDGVILFDRKENFFARVFNRDGSEAEISGNGIRCLAAVINFLWGIRDKLMVNTLYGSREIVLKDVINEREFLFEMDLGDVKKVEDMVVFLKEKNAWINGIYVELSNPHFVVFKEDFKREELLLLGPLIEKNSLFPNGVNVEFTKILSKDEIFSYFWERGVGYTLSSGTGSAASSVAVIKRFSFPDSMTVYTEGGNYEVRFYKNKIFQKGQATFLFKGEFFY